MYMPTFFACVRTFQCQRFLPGYRIRTYQRFLPDFRAKNPAAQGLHTSPGSPLLLPGSHATQSLGLSPPTRVVSFPAAFAEGEAVVVVVVVVAVVALAVMVCA